MLWAKTLILANGESIESRLLTIFSALRNKLGNIKGEITNIDATGQVGGNLTERNNNEGDIFTDMEELIKLTQVDGQVIELDVKFHWSTPIELIVTDRQYIDVVSEDQSLLPLIGNYDDLDPESFKDTLF